MTLVILEFVADEGPQLCDQAFVLRSIAQRLGLQVADLIQQSGPTISATTVWNARTEQVVAVFCPMRSLIDMVR